jgi:hypothetical protein
LLSGSIQDLGDLPIPAAGRRFDLWDDQLREGFCSVGQTNGLASDDP